MVSPASPSASSSSLSRRCRFCGRTFSRAEHLQRHLVTHGQQKRYKCRSCDQKFTRSDAVRRHEQARHATDGLEVTSMRHACQACGRARVLCPGGNPCGRCEHKAVPCIYVRRKRRKGDTPLPIDGDRETAAECNVTDGGSIAHSTPPIAHAHAQPLPLGYPREDSTETTAVNWLPFDVFDHSELMETNSTPSGGQTLPCPTDLPELPGPGGRTHAMASQTSASQSETLASLIASMGRASQAFASSTPRRNGLDQSDTNQREQSLYADGAGARTSQAERVMRHRRSRMHTHRRMSRAESVSTPESECSWLPLMEEGIHVACSTENAQLYQIPPDVYQELVAKVDTRISFNSTPSIYLLSSRNFPTKNSLDHFIQLYFDRFHPVYPFLDLPLLSMPLWGWSLCLATAAIGCRYSDAPKTGICSDALSVALRETLITELDFGCNENTLPYLQASLLNVVGLCQSGTPEVVAFGREAIHPVMNACMRFALFSEVGAGTKRQDAQMDVGQTWTAWRCHEMRRRTGFFAWIIDCAMAFTSMQSPVLSLQALDLSLPSPEVLWEADSAFAWQQAAERQASLESSTGGLPDQHGSQISFTTVIAHLYRRQEFVQGGSEFTTMACIYALIRRNWELVRYFDWPFHESPFTRCFGQSRTVDYLPAISEFTKWRNRACDALDILHWDALGNSAKTGGLEGPVFLQLHLARLLLLAPVNESLSLVDQCIRGNRELELPHSGGVQGNCPQVGQQIISTWVHQDRYKARLAVIHAGATFWHVRRYATDAFVQPFAVFLAAIVLHFFAQQCATNPSPLYYQTQQGRGREDVIEKSCDQMHALIDPAQVSGPDQTVRSRLRSRMPRFLHIDRPIDDEFVQYFVRYGHSDITICAESIDDLCSVQGAKEILLEGAALLKESSSVWPMSDKYAQTLSALAHEDGSPDLS